MRQRKNEQMVMDAVRSLRTALGMTQTDFGGALGKSLPTIQRWETLRPPRGAALMDLYHLAGRNQDPKKPDARLVEIAGIFKKALSAEFGDVDALVNYVDALQTLFEVMKELKDIIPEPQRSKLNKAIADLNVVTVPEKSVGKKR
jgi:transcriptional regulator with XRE-family HTH domain